MKAAPDQQETRESPEAPQRQRRDDALTGSKSEKEALAGESRSPSAVLPDDGEADMLEVRKVNWVAVTLLCLLLMAIAAGAVALLVLFRPQAAKDVREAAVTIVEVASIDVQDVSLPVPTQGTVEPRIRTQAASEVAGRVTYVSPNFKVGATIREDEVLLRVDDADYRARVAQAAAEVEDARLALKLEKARAEQARRDWESLGGPGDEPSDLVLRKPQLASAEARLEAAIAELQRSERDVARTELKAPYDGRISSTSTDIGSYVTIGSPLAEMYAATPLEVTLPLSLLNYGHVGGAQSGIGASVDLTIGKGGTESVKAEVVRIQGEVDRRTRSINLIAELDPEVAEAAVMGGGVAPGMFVTAKVEGKVENAVVEVPRQALFDSDTVIVVSKEARDDEDPKEGPKYVIRFRDVDVRRLGEKAVYVSASAFEPDDRLCLTSLATPFNGMEVEILGEEGDTDGQPAQEEGAKAPQG